MRRTLSVATISCKKCKKEISNYDKECVQCGEYNETYGGSFEDAKAKAKTIAKTESKSAIPFYPNPGLTSAVAVLFLIIGFNAFGIRDAVLGGVSGLTVITNARSIIADDLKSPSSYKENSSKVMWSGKNSDGQKSWIVELDYEAANSYGANVRGCKYVAFSKKSGKITWSLNYGIRDCTSYLSDEDVVAMFQEIAFGLEKNVNVRSAEVVY